MGLTRIGISYGHGGVIGDCGAVGKVVELKINKEVVGEMIRISKQDKLIELVSCNYGQDYYCKEQKTNLNNIINKANNSKLKAFIDVHHNAGGGTGVEVFAVSDNGRKLATAVGKEIAKGLDLINRGVKSQSFMVLRKTTMPAILVEGWFVDSTKDYEKYNVEKEARAILTGIYNYLGLKKPTVEAEKIYVVKKGDTLYSIAKKLGKHIDYLIEKNNIVNRNLIAIGDKIKY